MSLSHENTLTVHLLWIYYIDTKGHLRNITITETIAWQSFLIEPQSGFNQFHGMATDLNVLKRQADELSPNHLPSPPSPPLFTQRPNQRVKVLHWIVGCPRQRTLPLSHHPSLPPHPQAGRCLFSQVIIIKSTFVANLPPTQQRRLVELSCILAI